MLGVNTLFCNILCTNLTVSTIPTHFIWCKSMFSLYFCIYLTVSYKLWNHLNLWGKIFVDCGFLLICGDVNSWSVFSFSKKLTLSNFIFINDVNSRGIHEYHENWAMTNSNISTVPPHYISIILFLCVCTYSTVLLCLHIGMNKSRFFLHLCTYFKNSFYCTYTLW